MKKQQQTRVRLKASVKEMLKQNPMRAINIKSISAASHISRTSFYANFENMDDLIYELHDDFISGIGDIYKKDLRAACLSKYINGSVGIHTQQPVSYSVFAPSRRSGFIHEKNLFAQYKIYNAIF